MNLPEETRIWIKHYRYVLNLDKSYNDILKLLPAKKIKELELQPHLRGGKTEAIVILPDGNKVKGEAICSMKDSFNRKIGRDVAVGRALKKLLF